MIALWIILGIIVIPAILNVVYAYTIVKFNLWNGISEFVLCDCRTNHKMNKTNTIFLIAPFLSLMYFVVTFAIYFAVGMYKIFNVILYPFIKVYEFLVNSLLEHFNKIEDKREFFEKLNNH